MAVKRKTNKKLLRGIKELSKDVSLKVGWIEKHEYPNGFTTAAAASLNEFGSIKGGIPPRPFMRPTIADEEENWAKTAKKYGKMVVQGGMSAEDSYKALGLLASGDIRATISKIYTPELKDATVAARKRKYATKSTGSPTKPLVDSGTMLATCTYQVES